MAHYQVNIRGKSWLGLSIGGILLLTAIQLHRQGRVAWCTCGHWKIWAGDIWSAHNSQHIFDPYSFTHVLHGVILFGVLYWVLPRVPPAWRLACAVLLEALWEIMENSRLIIMRYREATIGLGYEGDSIVNSIADIACCGVGFMLAQRLGWRRSVVLFVAIELALLLWVRDNLTLNILMLVCPVEAIKSWQMVQ